MISKHSHTNWLVYKIMSAPAASEVRTISSTLLASSFPMPWKLCNISGARNRFHLPEDLPQVCWLCKTEISQHRLYCQDATQTTTRTAIKAVWTFTFVIMYTGAGLWHIHAHWKRWVANCPSWQRMTNTRKIMQYSDCTFLQYELFFEWICNRAE